MALAIDLFMSYFSSFAKVFAINFSEKTMNLSCTPSPMRPALSYALTVKVSFLPSTSVRRLSQ